MTIWGVISLLSSLLSFYTIFWLYEGSWSQGFDGRIHHISAASSRGSKSDEYSLDPSQKQGVFARDFMFPMICE